MTAALRIRNLSKTFPGQRALDAIDLEIAPGEIHALVGQNGSGKSTIVKILAGYHAARPGRRGRGRRRPVRARLGGGGRGGRAALRPPGPRPRRDDDGVRQLPPEPTAAGARRRCAAATTDRDASAALDALGYDIDPTRTIAELAESERTAVAVARALDGAGDDGTLPAARARRGHGVPARPRGRAAVRRPAPGRRPAARRCCSSRHYLDEVLTIADRVTVLRDGRRVATEASAAAHPRAPRQADARARARRRGRRPHPGRAHAADGCRRCCRRAASAAPSWRRSTSTSTPARWSASPG